MKRFAAVLLLAGCSSAPSASPAPSSNREPDRIVVQHVLISFGGAGTKATRTKAEAEALATALLDRARKGEDFDAMVKQYSDDSGSGTYAMANFDAPPGGPADEHLRSRMITAFGNVGFKLEIGGFGLTPFSPRESPYGWHLIKRLK